MTAVANLTTVGARYLTDLDPVHLFIAATYCLKYNRNCDPGTQCSAYAEQSSLDNQCCPLEGSHYHFHRALVALGAFITSWYKRA
eukprot:9608988-Heterocapsa_arctica.AAC.1